MLNDWEWEHIDDAEERLKDNHGDIIAYLIRQNMDNWCCRLFNGRDSIDRTVIINDMENIDEARWQATIWIYKTCNRIANNFHYIRDHLPPLGDLYAQYIESQN